MAAERADLPILDISNLSFDDSMRVEKLVAQLKVKISNSIVGSNHYVKVLSTSTRTSFRYGRNTDTDFHYL